MDPNVNPDLAADLSKPSDKELAADLSKQGSEARKRAAKAREALAWAKAMNRTFKGIAGSKSRDGYAVLAMERFNLKRDS